MSDGGGEVAAQRRLTHSGETDALMFTIVGVLALVAYRDVFGSWSNFIGPTFGGVIGGAIVAYLLRPRFPIGRAFGP